MLNPPDCRHLLTVEAVPADPLDPDCAEYEFLSRCICGTDIRPLPWPSLCAAIGAHLRAVSLLPLDE